MQNSAQRQQPLILSSEEIRQEWARRRFLDFFVYTMPDASINWHHRVICEEIDALIRSETSRLILTMPPRHSKSELVSRRLPAYILGRDPDAQIIACSYSADLAQRLNRDVQRIIDSPAYAELFPGTKLHGSNVRTVAQGTYLRNSDIFEVVGRKGTYRSAGVGGGITGMGAHYAIIDDAVKSAEDVASDKIRESLWEWYTSVLYTRLEPGGKIIIIMTRWHEDDLVGRLLESMKNPDGEQWRVISFPAVYEGRRSDTHEADRRKEGEALWPSKFDLCRLDMIKNAVGSRTWAGLYQQRPAPIEGGLFKRSWFQHWENIPNYFDEMCQSWDLSFKGGAANDYVVGQVWGRIDANYYLLDQTREKLDFPETIKTIKHLSRKWPEARKILIEDTANGPAVISTLQNEIGGIVGVKPQGSKEARASAITALVEGGNVYLPSPRYAWVGDFIEECCTFPNGTHDDALDAMTQALTKLALSKKMQIWSGSIRHGI